MKKRLLACTLAATMILGSTAPVLAADDGSTQGTNTFVDGGTDLSFWTFQELHVDSGHQWLMYGMSRIQTDQLT